MKGVLLEAVVVGLMVGVALAAVAAWKPLTNPWDGFLYGTALGVAFHFGCEIAGVNRWYCRNGAACLAT